MIERELIQKILAIHFDPEKGTPYWLEKEKERSLNVRSQICRWEDFHLLGPMSVDELRTRPLSDFIPFSLQHKLPEMILSETGGTTGPPCRRVFLPEEFDNAFIRPWLQAVSERNFPVRGRWLFIGPGGPHIIAQAARKMARAVQSLEPFSVDCDVRWFRRQENPSLGFTLYLDHVLDQAMNIINCQNIDTLFTTPILLSSLAEQMSIRQRAQIRGIHTGGMEQSAELTASLRESFPNAVILPGYGNSLFGVTYEEQETKTGEDSVFSMKDPAMWLQLVPVTNDENIDLQTVQPEGEKGRVVLHRLDVSFLIINLLERDCGTYVGHDNFRKISKVSAFEQAVQKQTGGVY